MKDFVITMSGSAEWGPQGSRVLARYVPRDPIQEQVAALLVARGWAVRKPLKEHRCWKTIELKAINDGCGFLYVTEAGEIRAGHTMRESRRVGPQTRRRMLGEEN